MKKLLIAFTILLILFTACVYFLIPSKLDVSAVAVIVAPAGGVYRCVANENKRNQWLNESNDPYIKKYHSVSSIPNLIDVLIYNGKDSIKSVINFLPFGNDSMATQWKFSIDLGLNPFTRIHNYIEAVQIKKNMDNILLQLKSFASKNENIYGFNVYESSTKDTLLLSAKTNLTHYPATEDIYGLIDKLKKHAIESNAQITGYPMYNVTKVNDDTLRLMAALPINKELPQQDSFSPVRMVPGKFLIMQVTGGNATVKNAISQMQLYFAEHNRIAMAIPFAYLITDRRQEADTLKWVTKIYAPVF